MSETFGSFWNYFTPEHITAAFFALFIMFSVLVCPVLLTLANIVFLIFPPKKPWSNGLWISSSLATLFFGSIDSILYAGYYEMEIVDWDTPIYSWQVHTPISTEHFPTICVFALIGILGFIILLLPVKKMPPLLFVFGITFMYFGVIVDILWAVQTSTIVNDLYYIPFFALFSFDLLLMAATATRKKVIEYNEAVKNGLLLNKRFRILNDLMKRGEFLPVYAFALFFPVFALVMAVLILFGQDIDSVIKAWTETSDWVLSTRQSPPPLESNGHYLCTVAAGGHKSVVKPQRDGRRHGARITVNRQLCIANAFEQLLEERMPNIHRAVRGFYDKYGYPVSKHIRTKLSADIVYVIMKPLEWFFLFVLYIADVRPERRIAVQYLPEKDKKELLDYIDNNSEI